MGTESTEAIADRELGNFLKWGGAVVAVVGFLTGFLLIGHEVVWLFPMGVAGLGAIASRIGESMIWRADEARTRRPRT